jgi:hypothetical protein
VPEDWWFFPVVARLHKERTGYPTQKPIALLDRIVLASSNPGDLVADFFCGSGTALLAAARNGRRWLGCDSAALACATTYRRLMLECPGESLEWLSDRPAIPKPLEPFVEISMNDSQLTVRAKGRKRLQWLEVDWDFDGEAFDSLSRAALPWRSAGPLPALRHQVARSGRHSIAVRAADPAGRVYAARLAVHVPSSAQTKRAPPRRR